LTIIKDHNTLEGTIDSAKKAKININYMKRDFIRAKILNKNKKDTSKKKRKRKPRCYKCKIKGHTFTECKE